MEACKFSFDGGPVWDGFAHGTTWNGFDNVAVSKETLAKIIKWTKEDGGDPADFESLALDPMENGLISLGWGYTTVIIENLEELLADHFAEGLRDRLGTVKFDEMKRRNETDPRYATTSCASHDFCDANMVMDAVWRDAFIEPINADDEAQAKLWSKAWEIAREKHLGHQQH